MEPPVSPPQLLPISDLLRYHHPISATFSPHSLTPTPNPNPFSSSNPQVLRSLSSPSTLIGTLSLLLPSPTTPHSCFQFSDGSSSIFCDVLEFNPNLINNKIRVLSWNFIPFKKSNTCAAGGGVLEIIKWEFLGDGVISQNSIRLGSDDSVGEEGGEDNRKARHVLSGVLDSVSPVSLVSCSGNEGDMESFIVEILSCDCQLCVGKKHSGVKGEHRYVKSNFVYFSGGVVLWHLAFKKMVGRFVGLSGLKKKSVHLGKGKGEGQGQGQGLGQLMFVSTKATCLHCHKLGNGDFSVRNGKSNKIMGRGELGLYVGVVKGVYMQGAIVELDDDVMLLVTDHSIVVPHSLRVGAVLCARNVHIVNPKFLWRRMLVLGTCCKTNINISSFSPLASGCQLALQSKSRLGRFISSLAFAVRLWALLMLQCLRKKFSGPFTEKEILGSKHSQGMVETYLRSVLASSSRIRSRDSIFVEFCKHDSHGTCSSAISGSLCLAVPFSIFVDNCDRIFVKSILQVHNGLGILEDCDPLNPFLKVNRVVNQPMRKILSSKEIGVSLIGNLKISLATGRLQYIDATGSIDVVIPDLPSSWDMKATYEVYDYSLVLEGRPELSDQAHIHGDDFFSCRCITSSIRSQKQTGLEVFVHCFWKNVVQRELEIHHCPTSEENVVMLDPETFHLLHLRHIFPSQSKFHGNLLLSGKGFSFAEATALPWNLNIAVSDVAAVTDNTSQHELQQSCESGFTFKKCKRDLASGWVKKVEDEEQRKRSNSHSYNLLSLPHKTRAVCDASGTSPVRIPCTVTVGRLRGDNMEVSTNLCSTQYAKDFDVRNLTSLKKVLLEFDSEHFFKYKLLHIGGYYIVNHDGKKCFCDSSDVSGSKLVISSGRELSRLSFHFDEDAATPGLCHLNSLHLSCITEGSSRLHTPSELLMHPSSIFDDEIFSDISLHVAKNVNVQNLELLKQDVVISAMLSRDVCSTGVNGSSALSSFQNQEACSRTILPQGNVLSLQGVVLSLHSGCCAFDGVLHDTTSHDVHKQTFSHGAENLICLHIVTEGRKVVIEGCLGKNDYPVGLGPGADVTFHRILIGGHDRFMLIPVSFITVNSVKDALSPDVYSCHSLSEEIVAHCSVASLIQLEPSYPRRFGCRVVAIHIVKLKRRKNLDSILSDNLALKSMAYVELAGFIIDDGSSQKCCWANGERASMLLRLHEQLPHLGFKSSWWSKGTGSGKARNTLSIYLENILKRHESITVKNFGASYETSGQLSFGSDYTFCTEDEILLKIVILNACASMSWSMIGHVLDLNAMKVLEKYLLKEHMKMPDLQNVWAREVSPGDALVEARSLYQDL